MSLFNKDFLKDSLIGNEDDSNQFYLHQDNNFGSDPLHSNNGFGLQGFGGHNNSHLQQQRSLQQPGPNLGLQQQQQLYRPSPGHVGIPNVQQQDQGHFLNAANRPSPFPAQGIIGGNLSNNAPGRTAADITVGNGRLPVGAPDVGFNGLGRFPGHTGGSFNPLGGTGRNEDDFLGGNNNDADDFPALPSSNPLGGKHDTTSSSHLGGMLGGNNNSNSLFLKEALGSSLLGPTAGGGGARGPGNQTGGHPSSLYPSGLGGLGSGGVESGNVSSNSSLSGATTGTSSLLGSVGLSSSLGGNSVSSVGLTKESRYAMAGLLDTIRSTDKDLQVLTLGTDLTTFGLNLNSVDTLYTSFVSPFVDNPPSDEPQYKTPQCYLMAHTPVLKADHWSKLTIETLFYIFYQMPRDILQACAAQELYRRDWRYHGELRIWVKPANRPDLMTPTPQFVYFDAKAWEQKFLNTAQLRGNLLAGLIPEEEIRVKVPAPGQNPVVEPS